MKGTTKLNTSTLIPILGTDKSNPAFSVYTPIGNKDFFEVYFGLALLEKVNGNTDDIQFKYLVGRLYNAGITRNKLVEAFEVPLSTMRRYGEAVKSNDPEEMMRRFSGQGAEKKLTQEIENYIRCEFRKLYQENKYTYSSEIIAKVKEIFAVPFSSETLRHIFNDEKRILLEQEKCVPDGSGSTEKSPKRANACDCPPSLASKESNNRRYSLSNFDITGEAPAPFLLKHAGLALVLSSIKELNINNPLSEQWMASVLLGAMNIEQSGRLDFHALDFLLADKTISSTDYQRILLKSLATDKKNVTELFRANAAFIEIAKKGSVFFYDPHGVKYTGMKDILKGWCGSIGKINKVNYQDFMHTVDGCPVYFEIHDNYLDMRERLIDELEHFSSEFFSESVKPTMIVDRGIYGKDKMIELDSKGYGLVTWSKNYKKDAWDEDKQETTFKIKRCKNNSKDIKIWNIRFITDDTWNEIENYHRIIVRITPPNSKQEFEVPILSNGKIDDLLAVTYMLTRWIQENDYGYMDRNFGINEITTYKEYDYSNLILKEKKAYSEIYDFLCKKKRQTDSKLKVLLLENERKKMKGTELSIKKQWKIEELKQNVMELEQEKKAASEKIDKAAKLIGQGKKRLAYDTKYYMDTIKITARNIFCSLIAKFRPHLDNYRDDHQLLRELTRAPGYIEYSDTALSIQLHPDRNYQPRQRTAILCFLTMISEEINEKNPGKFPVNITLSRYMNKGYPPKKESV